MIINNSAILIIGSVLCFLGSIPTLILCCCNCENGEQIELIQNTNENFNNNFDNDNKKKNKYLDL